MPVNDWYSDDPGLNRTMCPKCGEDTHFIVQADWNQKSPYAGDDWEDRYQKFRRHINPPTARELFKPIINDDSQITCGSCGNVFARVDGRQTYVDHERESVESVIVPSMEPLPSPSIRLYERNEGILEVPVAAYDIIHQTGFGGRGVSSYTSVITLKAYTNALQKASWLVDIPSAPGRYHSNEYASIDIGPIANVDTPVSIDPVHLMAMARSLYGNYLSVSRGKDTEDVEYDPKERRDDDGRSTEISKEEADQIIEVTKAVYNTGSVVRHLIGIMTNKPGNFGFQIVEHRERGIIMQALGSPGRILKSAARQAGVELVGGYAPHWGWHETARAGDDIVKHHGAACFYH